MISAMPWSGIFVPRGERGRFLDGETEPVHAGIEMECRAAGQPLASGTRPIREFHHAADHRPGVDLGVSRGRASGRDAVEHVDRGPFRCDRPHARASARWATKKSGSRCGEFAATGSRPQP